MGIYLSEVRQDEAFLRFALKVIVHKHAYDLCYYRSVRGNNRWHSKSFKGLCGNYSLTHFLLYKAPFCALKRRFVLINVGKGTVSSLKAEHKVGTYALALARWEFGACVQQVEAAHLALF